MQHTAENIITENDLLQINEIIYRSFDVSGPHASEQAVNDYISLLNHRIATTTDRQEKIQLIGFIDKLNKQKQLIIKQNSPGYEERMREVAQRFGKKAQSGVGGDANTESSSAIKVVLATTAFDVLYGEENWYANLQKFYYWRAYTLTKLGDKFMEAMNSVNKALEINPDYPEAKQLKVEIEKHLRG
ncbi:MAG TPA: hypothetical protein PL045_02885 [Chitinophagaceae bacterium]|nr:hypothetical protein [Chitinophagaceae bacterium]